jgi:transcriptional regulator with XRE-family HTH domain
MLPMTETELRKEFGERLSLLRDHRRLTQEQLAELIGLAGHSIGMIEIGRQGVSFDTLGRLAEGLGVEVMELFRFDDTIPLRKKVSITHLEEKFGDRLRLLRAYRKIKRQKQLAKLADVSAAYISKLEKGGSSPSFETLAKLAEALNVEVIELFSFGRKLPK